MYMYMYVYVYVYVCMYICIYTIYISLPAVSLSACFIRSCVAQCLLACLHTQVLVRMRAKTHVLHRPLRGDPKKEDPEKRSVTVKFLKHDFQVTFWSDPLLGDGEFYLSLQPMRSAPPALFLWGREDAAVPHQGNIMYHNMTRNNTNTIICYTIVNYNIT